MKTRRLLIALSSATMVATTIPMVVSCNRGPQYPTLFLTYEQWENWNPTIQPIGGQVHDADALTTYLGWIKENPMIILEDCMNMWWPFHVVTDFYEISYSLIDVQPENGCISLRTYEKSIIDGALGTITTTYTNIKVKLTHMVGSESNWYWEIQPNVSAEDLKTDPNWSFECVAEGYNEEDRIWFNAKYNSNIVSKYENALYWALLEIGKFSWISNYMSETKGDDN